MLPTDLRRFLDTTGGLLTTPDAATLGAGPDDLGRLVRGGDLHRVRRGLYTGADVWAIATPWERYELTVRGVLRAHPGWHASHHAALALHGLPLVGVDLTCVDVVADVGTSKRRGGVHVHRLADHRRGTAPQDPRAVPVPEACVLTTAASGTEAGLVAMDAAVHAGTCTQEDLRTAASALVRGRRGALAAVEHVDPACESPGETRTRLLLTLAGWTVRSQVEISDVDGLVGRVDLLVGARVVVEFDGAVKYSGADGRAALVAEKRREDRLRAAGYVVVRVTWDDLRRPDRLVARVRAACALAA
ncbi:type IV toxin-antitoxin system AbiEi family antitoxin domain-containing protein [Phycicoccus sp. BSK3Z-2]|uniref:Type IV toxin-antitoxin system AbiEi family antitoxin domain-containing protein n=1 Tax=Phycicoccus avicenniae TaxID=2828860 RepID=A0A941I047_9MICO|nr:type IV toxin-antitoxin system AbiEi family antitoxin domain-containing protein [Phycicoccus avicenniae]MBR7743677.1 type IV toxin-antitoxin system AbiEi family antitoxin domain-containing protein [Phycicoccus avicenniae]